MANENDVVRLKHLNSLASVVHDITLHSGGDSQALPDNADFALYVPNDTSIIITGKQSPVLSLGSWSSADSVYSAAITYTGDGTLSTDIGTIANDILTVEDVDGNFNGIISASSGYDYAATKINFNYMTDTVTVEAEPVTVTVQAEPTTVTVEAEPVTVTVEAEPTTVTVQADPKTNPTFSLGEWAGSNNTYSAVVSYNGDGVLTANTGTLSGSTITVEDADGNFNGVISAAEGNNFAPAQLVFNHSKETVGGGAVSPAPASKIEGRITFDFGEGDEGISEHSGNASDFDNGVIVNYNGDGIMVYGLNGDGGTIWPYPSYPTIASGTKFAFNSRTGYDLNQYTSYLFYAPATENYTAAVGYFHIDD